MIQRVVERMYSETEENRFLEVTYANGDKEVLYFKDFNSGAMIENIVARAKKMAIEEFLDTGQKGMRVAHLLTACVDEFSENEDLPNTTNPDDWARISGKKGERIVYIRTLVSRKHRPHEALPNGLKEVLEMPAEAALGNPVRLSVRKLLQYYHTKQKKHSTTEEIGRDIAG